LELELFLVFVGKENIDVKHALMIYDIVSKLLL
jgi:hypothetical protein